MLHGLPGAAVQAVLHGLPGVVPAALARRPRAAAGVAPPGRPPLARPRLSVLHAVGSCALAAGQSLAALVELAAAVILELLGPVRIFVDVAAEVLAVGPQALKVLPVEVGVAEVRPVEVQVLDVIAAEVDIAVDVDVHVAMPAAATAATPPVRGGGAGDESPTCTANSMTQSARCASATSPRRFTASTMADLPW